MKQLCIVTMIGPFDLIGDLVTEGLGGLGEPHATLEHPCMLHPMQDGKVNIRNMTRGSGIIQGDSIVLNMRSVLWISEPSSSLRSAYQAQRAGIVVTGKMAKNSINIDQLRQ